MVSFVWIGVGDFSGGAPIQTMNSPLPYGEGWWDEN